MPLAHLPLTSTTQPIVLFVCQNNTARSIAAEFLCKHHIPNSSLSFHSAGLSPALIHARPKETVIQALATRGVPCTSAHSKSASSFIRVKYLIVLCCSVSDSDACSRSQAPGGCCKSPPEGSPAHEAFLHVELPNTKDYQGKMGEWVDKVRREKGRERRISCRCSQPSTNAPPCTARPPSAGRTSTQASPSSASSDVPRALKKMTARNKIDLRFQK